MRAAERTRTVVTGGAVARRVGTVGLLALVALSGLQCMQDLVVSPPRVKHEFSVSPDRDTLPIVGPQGDPIVFPFTPSLTADGAPVRHGIAVAVLQGALVLQADSAGRLRVVGRGEALLQVRPRNVALPDTLADTVSVLAVVPRIGLEPARAADTLTSLDDTLLLRAVALTARGDTIAGVPVPWAQVSGQAAVALLDAAAGRVRADSEGTAVFRASVDLVDTVRSVVVRQRPARVALSSDTLVFHYAGQVKPATAQVQDARGNPIAGPTAAWASPDTTVVKLQGPGLLEARADGTVPVAVSFTRDGTTATKSLIAVVRRARLTVLSGDVQTGTVTGLLGAPLVVQLADALGTVTEPGVAVAFHVSGGGAHFGAPTDTALIDTTVVTDAQGRAAVTPRLGRAAGTATFTVSGAGLAGPAAGFSATAQPAPASLLAFQTPPTTRTAGTTFAPAIQVVLHDVLGNVASTTTKDVTLAITPATNPGGAALAGTVTVTTSQGVATFADLRILKAGAGYTLTASTAGLPADTSAAFDVTAGPPATIAVTPAAAALQAGPTQTFTADVRDSVGNVATGAAVRWTSLNPQVVTIDSLTGGAMALRAGQATVAARAGSITAYALVTARSIGGGAVSLWVATPSGTTSALNDVWGSSASNVFAVGRDGTILHYDGTAWSAMSGTATSDTLRGVWGSSPSDVFAVGRNGRVLHYTGSGSWSAMAGIDPADQLFAVWGSSPRDVFAAGASASGGLVYHYDGTAWTKLTVPAAGSLRGLWGSAANDVWATGAGGVILHYDGVSWTTAVAERGDRDGWRVWGGAGNAVFATANTLPGGQLVIRRYDGSSWTETSTTLGAFRAGIWGNELTEVYASTDSSGPFVRYDGSSWATMGGARGTPMWGVWGSSDGAVWMVGDGGTVYRGYRSASVAVAPLTVGFAAIGRTQQLTATVRDASNNVLAGVPVTWTSGDPASVAVDAAGLVTALATGSATVSATVMGGAAGGATVGVTPIAVALTLAPTSATLAATGATRDLVALSQDSTAHRILGRRPVWTALVPGVATVAATNDTTARVTATGAGQTVVRADLDNLSVSALVTAAATGLQPVNVWQVARPAPDTALAGKILTGVWATSDSNVVVTGDRAFRFDGAAWHEFAVAVPGYSVGGVSSSRMWAVGNAGALYTYDGASWTAVASGTGNHLWGVWAASEQDAFVGGSNATMLHWNGTAWSTMTVPGPGTASLGSGLWGSSASDLWATAGANALLHYDGTAWSTVAVSGTFFGLWGTASNDVFAVGGAGALAHFNGSSWSAMASPTLENLRGVWGSSPTDVYASGSNGTILHYDGSTWTVLPTYTGTQLLHHVWGAPRGGVWVVGADGTGPALVLRGYRGGSVTVSPAGATLHALGATIGIAATVRDAGGATLAGVPLRWTSTAPGVARVDSLTGLVTAVSNGSATVRVTAAGGVFATVSVTVQQVSKTLTIAPTAAALSGAGATRSFTVTAQDSLGQAMPSPSLVWTSPNPTVATVNAAGVVTAVGSGQVVVTATDGGAVGSALVTVGVPAAAPVNLWAGPPTGLTSGFQAVWGAAPPDVFAVGSGGAVGHFDGAAWSAMSSGSTSLLYGVWGTRHGDVFAVGVGGTILHYDGTAWSAMASGTTVTLYAVWGTASANVWAAGLNGVLLHYDGAAWSTVATGTTARLQAVWGTGPGDVFVAGSGGTVLHFDGSTWSLMATGTTQLLYALWGTAPGDVYAITSSGALFRYDGSSWSAQGPNPAVAVRTLAGTSGADLYAVGSSGTLRRWDGAAWTAVSGATTSSLYGLWASGSDHLLAAGSAGTVLRGFRGATVAVTGAGWTATTQGMQQQLTATARDASSAVVGGVVFSWTSSDPAKATVDAAGLVTAVDTGTASVIASAPGGAADTLTLSLAALANVVKVTPSGAALSGVGVTQALAAEVRDASGNVVPSPTVAWASLDPAVATVDAASGVVTAVGAGQARIVATSAGLSGYAVVTVSVPGLPAVNLWAPLASGTTSDLHDVWGTSASDVWAAGDGPSLALHYDGTQWRTELSGIGGSNTYLGYAVGGTAANDVLVGTDGFGLVARFDGTTWSTLTPPAEYGTGIGVAVWAASPRETYVGITSTYSGSAGGVARYNQGTWTRVQGPTSVARLWGAAPGELFVAGNGTIWRCAGGSCAAAATPGTAAAIRGLWGAGASSAFAVGGAAGYAIAWDGANWTPMAGVPALTLNGITGSAANDLYAVGAGGAIARYDGASWTTPQSGTVANLNQAWTSPAGEVFVVGDAGTILRGVRGGTVALSSPSASPVAIGSARQLTATAYAGVTPLPGVAFTWASSDTAVARVDAVTGVVTGVAAGTATLTATAAGGAANTLLVTVSGSAGTVATVSVTPANPTLAGYGAKQQLAATARDAANDIIPGVTFTWSSADQTVATVHPSTGLVTALHTGTAGITATAPGGKTGSVTVTVEPSATSTVLVLPSGASLAGAGSTQTLGVQVRDPNGDLVPSPTATWASLNPLVATVDPATGVVTAVAPGQATITATSGGGTGAGLATVSAPVSAPVNLWVPMTTAGITWANAVWGLSATDLWAASGSSMLHFDGATWSSVGTPAGNTLTGVWGPAATDVFAVGYTGTIVHYDGSAWTAMASGSTQSLTDVWGTAHDDVFAVGASGTILHFDGAAWSAMTSGSTATLYAVWGTSRRNVWAAGSSGTILHYDGTSWAVVGSGTTATFYDLWGTAPDDVYASGSSGTVVHWTGSAWNPMTTGSTATLQDVWGTSGTDLYVVGTAGAVLRYDGSTWRAAAAGTAAQLTGVWGAGLGDVFAAVGSVAGGTYAVARGIRGATLDAAAGSWVVTGAGNQLQLTATVRDGAGSALLGVPLAWSSANDAIATVSASGLVTAVALGTTSVFITAPGGLADTVAVTVDKVANTVHVLPSSVTLASGGTRYLVVEVLDASGNPVSSPSVTFASLNPAVATVDASTGLVTAVEAGQATMVATSGGLSGSALVTVTKAPVSMVNLWAPLATGTTNGLQAVWGASAASVFAVGSSGSIVAWNGTSWSPMSSGTSQVLSDVWGTSATDVYAVGAGGAIVRYNGTTWSPMVSGTTQGLSGIWGASRSDVFAVGGTGTILRYDGTSWTAMASGTTQSLISVWGTSRTNVFAVGGNGTILHYDGAAWTPMSSGTSVYIYDVWGTSPTDVYALSTSSNAMLHYDGASWSALPAGASGYGLWGTTSSNIFVVGSSGAIARWDGSTWTAMTSGTSSSLMEIWGTSASEMTAVNQTGTVLRGIRGATVQVTTGSWNVTPQGNQQQLTATARDGLGAAVGGVPFAWTSTAPSVAAVNASGLVTAVSLGSADIIATAPGGLADTVTVTVTVVANAVTVSPTGVMLAGAGATQTIAVEVRDGSGTVVPSPTVAWASSNQAVATVDASGVVTAVAAGQTTIGATSGSVTGYATVTVSTPGTTPVNLWAPGTPPAGYPTLTGVWGSSPTNVYAASGSSQMWRWNGSAWSSVTTGVSGSYLTLWGSSATDVFAVGYSGTIAHWDGSAWSAMASGTSQPLNAVWGASPRDVFAVGNSGAIVHYDGNSWGPMASGTTQPLYGVWGTSRSDVYAVGYAGALLHYDGVAWSPMPGAQTGWYPRAVWGTGPTDVFAVGSGFYHWNGATWTQASTYPSNTMQAVWGTSPSDVYAAGYSAGLARYDGTTWALTSTTSMPTMTAIWSLGGSDLTVVGYSGTGSGVLRGVRGATITIAAGGWTISGTGAHQQLTATVRDGSGAILSGVPLAWTSANAAVATVNASGLVTGVALDTVTVTATAPGGATGRILVTVAMVANSVTVTPAGAAVAGVGTTQAFTATVRDGLGNIVPSPTVTWASLNPSVATVDPATGVATAVAAGQATIAATSGAVTSYALLTVAAAGSSRVNLWARASSGTTADVNGVWAVSPTSIYAVGAGGLILHFDGSTWSQQTGGLGSYLYDVWGASGTDVFAVGSGGAIRHYDGTSWSPMNGGTSQALQDVWGSSGSDVFAVGYGGTILHYDGSAWSTMVSGTSVQLQAVWGTSRSDVFAVGSDGTILHYDGSAWSAMPGGMGWYLTDVWGTSPTNVYASTYNAVLRYDGSAWTELSGSPYASTIWGTASTEVFEAYGATLSLFDGSTWTRVTAPGWLSALTGTTTGSVFAAGQAGTILRGVRGGTLVASAGSWGVTAQGNQLQVTATARDQAATDVPGAVLSWRSTNPAVARVDGTGLVTAVSVGGVDIIVTATGGLADTVPVTVSLVANQVTVVPGSATLNGAGATRTMSAVVRDAAGNVVPSPTVTWTSLNPAVASVNASTGVVTAVAAGQATIVATSGGLSATALVTATAATPAAVNLWAPAYTPATGSNLQIYGVWGSSANDVWAVGSSATVYHFNGASWGASSQVAGVYQELHDVWGSSASDVFAVGGNGTIVHFNGSTWSVMPTGTTVYLQAVWGSSPTDVYAAGEYGTLLHYDGSAWSAVPSGVADFYSPKIWGSSRNDLYVVSGSGAIHFDGTSWSTVPAVGWGYAVWGTAPTDVYAASWAVLRYDGANWNPMTGSTGTAFALWGSSGSEMYAVRDQGGVASWNGATWTDYRSVSDRDLNSVWGTSSGDVYAVGPNWYGLNAGIILRGVRGATVTVTPPNPTITGLGTTLQLTATGYAGATPVPGVAFTWSTSDPAVATVSATGLVTAVAAGTAVITATAPGGATAGTTVTVSP